jgi:hypothetical protein
MTSSSFINMENKEEVGKEELPKWMNFICPSCGIAYGINALVNMIRKRKTRRHIKVDNTSYT